MSEQLALFPLDYVLLPGIPLPLHVFEPRYRRLVADVAAAAADGHGRFGVVLGRVAVRPAIEPAVALPLPRPSVSAPTGSGSTEVAQIGTVAEIMENEPYADGRCDLLTVGRRRFRILEIDTTSHPYLNASIEYLDEQDGTPAPALMHSTIALVARYLDVLSEVSDSLSYTAGIDADPARVSDYSFEVAARLQISNSERQSLLDAPTGADRLAAITGLLRRELAIFATVTAVPVPSRALMVSSSLN